jgi:phosphate:Na+ symporter
MTFLGGVGLFLLGMRLMSDGLKIAAGPSLRGLLMAATGSRLRALASGTLVTALVQSSSAVIFATIGFVNAGLLSLAQAVGLILGANLGTTLTSWIVAVVGFSMDLKVLAMPAIGIGMALWIAGHGRRAALGQALVGFGVFFLGLDVLKDAFAGLGEALDLGGLDATGAGGIALFAGLGVLLTVLMQSSSAALAVALTAAAQGLLPLAAAGAVVVGANIGTTSTAVLATLGATAAAKRTAATHVLFNVVAGSLALAGLPWLLGLSRNLVEFGAGQDAPATVLAVLHTLINLLGVVALWPFLPRLVDWLEARFGAAERADEARPQHLDRHVLETPRLAVDALYLELRRMGAIAQRMARAVLSAEDGRDTELALDHERLDRLGAAILDFVPAIPSAGDAGIEAALPRAVRIAQYYRGMAERAADLARIPGESGLDAAVVSVLAEVRAAADRLLAAADPQTSETLDVGALVELEQAFEASYQHAKGDLLRRGSRGEITSTSLVRMLDRLSALHRILSQAGKAARLMADFDPAPAHLAAA